MYIPTVPMYSVGISFTVVVEPTHYLPTRYPQGTHYDTHQSHPHPFDALKKDDDVVLLSSVEYVLYIHKYQTSLRRCPRKS